MKKIMFLCAGLMLTAFSFGQEDPNLKLPPIEMLPKNGEVKKIYTLPDSMHYEIFDQKGSFVDSGKAEFIDYTELPEGVYFIRYKGKTKTFER